MSEQFVVVELDEKGYFVRPLAAARAQDANGRRDGVAASFVCQLDDLFGIEVVRVWRETRARGVLDPLVDWEDRKVPRLRQTAGVENCLHVSENGHRAVA